MLEPDDGKLSSPVLRGLAPSNGGRLLGTLRNRCRHRPMQYLNNILEQDHRAIKRRVNAKQGFREFQAARRTIQGYEAVHMIRKGQVRWVAGDDRLCQIQFIDTFRLGSLRTHDRRSATNLSAFETCNTTLGSILTLLWGRNGATVCRAPRLTALA